MNFNFSREDFIYNRLKTETRPIVIYGTGNGAEKLLRHLKAYGISVGGIFVSDDFARERQFCGYWVKTFRKLREELGEPVVLLGFATDRPELLSKIRQLSREVDGRLFVPEVPVFGNDIFTPELLHDHGEEISRLYDLLADEQSRRVLAELIRFKLTADPEALYSIETSRDEVYNNIIRPRSGDVFVDAGAFIGDTAEEFMGYCKDFGRIYAIEPAPVNFRKLSENPILKADPRVELINLAVSDRAGETRFSDKGGRSPYIAENGKITLRSDTLDNLIGVAPNIIKIDVEGVEAETLSGAAELIGKYAPKLMVSVYHKTEDFYKIPLLVHRMQPKYKLYLRHHPYLPAWETNLYAISQEDQP